MLTIKVNGFEIGATGHDITQNQLLKLKTQELNLTNISNVVNDYDPWSTNYFEISGPVIDNNLEINVYDGDKLLWKGDIDDTLDIYDHSEKFPEIEEFDEWDEPNQDGDAVAWEEHPRILYYEELNLGTVGIVTLNSEEFDPLNFSIVAGCLETDEVDWEYVNKMWYKGKPINFKPKEHELKNKYQKFKLIY